VEDDWRLSERWTVEPAKHTSGPAQRMESGRPGRLAETLVIVASANVQTALFFAASRLTRYSDDGTI
jgi:hypothetical protein